MVNRLTNAVLAALLVSACGSSPPHPPKQRSARLEPVEVAETEKPGPAATPRAIPVPRERLLDAVWQSDTLRDRAQMEVFLDLDGYLHVGAYQQHLPDTVQGRGLVFWQDQSRLDVYALPSGEPVVLLETPSEAEEDPPSRFRLFRIIDDGLVAVFDRELGVYGRHPLVYAGDGSFRFEEDDWSACERMGHPASAQIEEVRFELNARGNELVEVGRRVTGRSFPCDELAACPFVYLVEDGQERFVGEILRNLRGEEAYARQSLVLQGRSETRVVELTIREEKEEVTFLDTIHLQVDGVALSPEQCQEEGRFCTADRHFQRLDPGDELRLRFTVPWDASDIEVVAQGYYIPTPTRAARPFRR